MSAPYPVETKLDGEPDTDALYERYWEDYVEGCAAEGSTPSYKDFLRWYEENFV